MELFRDVKTVWLQSHHGKFLTAEEDEASVCQDRHCYSPRAMWTVEFVEGGRSIRLKSCFGRYLLASDEPFLLGMTGRRILQVVPALRLYSSALWEPVRDGSRCRVLLKNGYGQFLRANGGVLPPWRNSVTHDLPHLAATRDWILWDVHIVELLDQLPPSARASSSPSVSSADRASGSSSPRSADTSPRISLQLLPSPPSSTPPTYDGRTINYSVADEDGNVDDGSQGASFRFKERSVEELASKLEEAAGLYDMVVCSRNPLNGKLCPLRLPLPPNNDTVNVVLVSASSRVARGFAKSESPS